MTRKNKNSLFETYINENGSEEKRSVIISREKEGYRLVDSTVHSTREGRTFESLTFVYDRTYSDWLFKERKLTEEDFENSAREENENVVSENRKRYLDGYCVIIRKGKENAAKALKAIEDICLSFEGFWDYYYVDLSACLETIGKYVRKHDYVVFPDFGAHVCKRLAEELEKRGVEAQVAYFKGNEYVEQCRSIDPSFDVLTNSFSLQLFARSRKNEYLENKFNEAGKRRKGDLDSLRILPFIN